jgi:hypothetical protein
VNVQWFRGGLVFEAHRLLRHSLKDLQGPVTRVKKKKSGGEGIQCEKAIACVGGIRAHLTSVDI